jgi:hypothetical protein
LSQLHQQRGVTLDGRAWLAGVVIEGVEAVEAEVGLLTQEGDVADGGCYRRHIACTEGLSSMTARQKDSVAITPALTYWKLVERESIFFYHFTPTLFGKSVCGQLLITSLLVLLSSFEVLKKKSKKKKQQKNKKKEKIETTKKGLCVCFLSFCVVVLCDCLCVDARVSSIV